MEELDAFSGAVLTHSTLVSLLTGYKAPNYKIHTLLNEGRLIGLKKGLYAVAPKNKEQLIELPLVANHLYGPSYVSLEFALYHYGIIPEHVADITSVSTKRGKAFNTPFGRFTYQQLPPEYYALGVRTVRASDSVAYMMATPEKALCDWLALTPNLRIYSAKGLATLLLEDMRMDEVVLGSMNINVVKTIASVGFRAARLSFLPECLEGLAC